MTLDKLLKQEDCTHPYLRCDKPFHTAEYDDKGKEILIPMFTCHHPEQAHCGASLAGKDRISGYGYIVRFEGKIYYSKVKQ